MTERRLVILCDGGALHADALRRKDRRERGVDFTTLPDLLLKALEPGIGSKLQCRHEDRLFLSLASKGAASFTARIGEAWTVLPLPFAIASGRVQEEVVDDDRRREEYDALPLSSGQSAMPAFDREVRDNTLKDAAPPQLRFTADLAFLLGLLVANKDQQDNPLVAVISDQASIIHALGQARSLGLEVFLVWFEDEAPGLFSLARRNGITPVPIEPDQATTISKRPTEVPILNLLRRGVGSQFATPSATGAIPNISKLKRSADEDPSMPRGRAPR